MKKGQQTPDRSALPNMAAKQDQAHADSTHPIKRCAALWLLLAQEGHIPLRKRVNGVIVLQVHAIILHPLYTARRGRRHIYTVAGTNHRRGERIYP
eukprot:1554245-Pyramimonas_sp.AAC.1